MTKTQRAALKQIKTTATAALTDYYANSLSEAVNDDYRNGRVVVVNADAPRTPRVAAAEPQPIPEELRKLTDARDAEYWRFSRCSRYSPVRMAELDYQIANFKRGL